MQITSRANHDENIAGVGTGLSVCWERRATGWGVPPMCG